MRPFLQSKGYDDIPKEIPDPDAKKARIESCVSIYYTSIKSYCSY